MLYHLCQEVGWCIISEDCYSATPFFRSKVFCVSHGGGRQWKIGDQQLLAVGAYPRGTGVVQEHGLVAGTGATVEIADEGGVVVAYEPVQMMNLANVLRELGVVLVCIVVAVDLSTLLVVWRIEIRETVLVQESRFPGSHEKQRVIAMNLNTIVIRGQFADDVRSVA